MRKLLALTCLAFVVCAQAQTTTISSTTSSPGTTTTSTSNTSGTVTDYTPGVAIVLDPGTGKPVHFLLGKKVQVLGPDGRVIAETDVKKNAKVHLRLVQEGDRTVVDRIAVEEK
jgi:ABC-type Fe3+-hydroxamate transport system substrate-binding protein